MRGNGQFEDWVERARAAPIEGEIDRRGIKLTRQGIAELVGPCPKCGGDDRFGVNTSKQVFNCRGCIVGGDVIKLVEHLDDVDFVTACTTLTGRPPPQVNGKDSAGNPEKIIVAEYPYLDEAGNVLFIVERVEFRNSDGSYLLNDGGKRQKTFRQKRPDPNRPGEWVFNVHGVPVMPYRLPELIEAIANERQILIVEGEAKVDLLLSWNVAATCCAGGSKKWKPEHSKFLRGADIVILPDNDRRGWEHVNLVGAALLNVAKRVRVLVLPNLQPKGDVVDWAKSGGTRERLDALINEARDWSPPIADGENEEKVKAKRREDELLDALADTPPGIEFARGRKKAAKELDVPPSAIDAELEARRCQREVAPLYEHWITEPWPEQVDGDSLLRDIIRRIRRHVVCADHDALSIALWIMLSWVHEQVATHSPILVICSAEPESGKSTTLGLIAFLAPKCLWSVEISEAALYRAIKLWRPTFAIDEFDSVLASDDKVGLRAVINSGHNRGQGVVRCVGDDKTPELFPTFCPKALGMCGRKLPASTLSRCIFVELRRRRKDERIDKFKHEDDGELADLRRRLRRWTIDNEETLRGAAPSIPDGLENRRADNWRLQLAIADLAGGDWGEKTRAAAMKIEGMADHRTAGVRLLTDIKALFDADPQAHCMHSKTMVEELVKDAEKPWAEPTRGKPLTQNRLAKLLGAYRITSQTVTPPGGKDGKGYYRSQFEDAWSRYLPASSASIDAESI